MAAAERRTEQAIKVRQVTDYQASWTELERGTSGAGGGNLGTPGAFTVQLILDNGAEEYVLRPTAEDSDVLVDLFEQTGTLYFDTERGVLVFGNISVDQRAK